MISKHRGTSPLMTGTPGTGHTPALAGAAARAKRGRAAGRSAVALTGMQRKWVDAVRRRPEVREDCDCG